VIKLFVKITVMNMDFVTKKLIHANVMKVMSEDLVIKKFVLKIVIKRDNVKMEYVIVIPVMKDLIVQ
jgi:acetone carboxylase gamma subunit